MNILHIETATATCSVALSINGVLVSCRDHHEHNAHASMLTIFIKEVMAKSGLEMKDLDAIAVSKGPGSYTGLRIGVSVAKGICYALDIPLIAINTLDAMVTGYIDQLKSLRKDDLSLDSLFCPMIDARRMEVYTAIYRLDLQPQEATAARVIDENTFDHLTEKYQLVLFGDGANKLSSLFEQSERIKVVSGFQNSARYLLKEAKEKFNNHQFEDVAYFEPFYLKDFVPTTPKKRFFSQ
ncbi:tRNA (adenosine(37)-N6)-threonylcarbamoyltransferase complex dimerization subunit type 1 TsaB [Olivibacter sp. SDN3]|uniref:tRNA (adenosine(37)-N6)-threonylcarbamoyltransferase complex dimerization subunit type 1 TsaB n=1 Tax=Olivibacter sp. SDN3 TaxID=2764720 RepID=UPI001651997E|nr:tRNA (adenosine(37)-N6)-threonylcarbamoyltransferase complex dimerization subunit type 1 TsaB [Olivibacter sp. SDN3]QNL50359.1 tRNA (adenosine(37)-N6)-threonylcarbamoyltransferase complex dimerization subunit type 1 TsaB [Olivibacter sp. SDN3]